MDRFDWDLEKLLRMYESKAEAPLLFEEAEELVPELSLLAVDVRFSPAELPGRTSCFTEADRRGLSRADETEALRDMDEGAAGPLG